ncbi:MAG: hypothetical protein EA393_09055 [Bacteroidetes bacterium]|nr:MAG: hypothetical protein EA393_09055 [Bacteroidota bacterium]
MEKINQFSIQRLFLLMKRHSVMNAKTWLIGLGALSGILIIIALIQSYSNGFFDLESLVTIGTIFIFIGGFIVTSAAYNELHTPARGQFYLILPANTLEKLLSNWLLSSAVFVVVAFVLLSVVLGITTLLSSWVFNTDTAFFNPFTHDNLENMGVYVVVQSIFFLGALYFRKNNFIKTLLSVFVVMFGLSIILGFLGWVILGEFNHISDENLPESNFVFFTETLPQIARIIFWWLTAPFFLLVSYFKLKEREV